MGPTKEDLREEEVRDMREKVLELTQDRYGTEPEYLFAKYPGFAVLRHPNKKWYGVIMDLPREKLGLPGEGMVDALNVKCDPCMSGSLRLQPGILPGYISPLSALGQREKCSFVCPFPDIGKNSFVPQICLRMATPPLQMYASSYSFK